MGLVCNADHRNEETATSLFPGLKSDRDCLPFQSGIRILLDSTHSCQPVLFCQRTVLSQASHSRDLNPSTLQCSPGLNSIQKSRVYQCKNYIQIQLPHTTGICCKLTSKFSAGPYHNFKKVSFILKILDCCL